MATQTLKGIRTWTAVLLIVLTVAACAIRLRGEEAPTNTTDRDEVTPDPLTTTLRQCRSVTSEQKQALSASRKAWADKRRQFLGQSSQALPEGADAQDRPSLFVAPKYESRLPSRDPSIPQSGKE
jgi:conjugative transfer region protein TrbK